ncbi:hypothetical protein K435DRAFT_866448 [Dendrothele bispora CBS 962.96]|uniref:Uncharacterized protein n=1 Tax=Dendrothele bispora (strain CBS 962.96) TaxID=1314807 RepID=A0A4S8LGT5_DENBC|nr:hypothetical protein K435DRAFT_866448 [Dendrothele bispora CBS 962.96]
MAINWTEVFGTQPSSTDSKVNYFGYRDAANKWQLIVNTPLLFDIGTAVDNTPPVLSAEQVAAMGSDSDGENEDEYPNIDPETLRVHEFIEQGKSPIPIQDRWFLSQIQDPHGKLCDLAKKENLLSTRVNVPEVFDPKFEAPKPPTGIAILTHMYILPTTPDGLTQFYSNTYQNLPPPTLPAVPATPTKGKKRVNDGDEMLTSPLAQSPQEAPSSSLGKPSPTKKTRTKASASNSSSGLTTSRTRSSGRATHDNI